VRDTDVCIWEDNLRLWSKGEQKCRVIKKKFVYVVATTKRERRRSGILLLHRNGVVQTLRHQQFYPRLFFILPWRFRPTIFKIWRLRLFNEFLIFYSKENISFLPRVIGIQ
jgi:hypothetical protein